MKEFIIVLDLGGEAQAISRAIRAMNVYCEVQTEASAIECRNANGVVIAGCEKYKEDAAEAAAIIAEKGLLHFECMSGEIDEGALHGFLFNKCKLNGDWDIKRFVADSISEIKRTVGNKKVLCALSGGVDSSVVAALIYKAVGEQLTCIFVDTGLMRKDEGNEVCGAFKDAFGVAVTRVSAEERFLSKLAGITDPEQKRKIIGEEFIRVFEEEGKKIGAVGFLAQGTIYPDIIESGSKRTEVIKSHHNVGGLPDVIDFEELIEPLKYLFKDEVRLAGKALGLPDSLVMRQPFPGPGLAVRCIGEVTKEKLDILREADFIFREEIAKAGYDTKIWQYFAVMTGLRSVGAKNGKRTYGYTIALRAVNSVDAMTGVWVRVPFDILAVVSDRIVSEVFEVNRVVFDITDKPPGTIEWE